MAEAHNLQPTASALWLLGLSMLMLAVLPAAGAPAAAGDAIGVARRLPPLPARNGAPVRNGVLAFTGWSGPSDIATVALDGSGLTSLVKGPAEDVEPAWSPDGSMLAFVSNRDGDGEIYVLDVATKRVRQLTRNRVADSSPSWAPGGDRIALTRTAKGQLFVMRADGSHQRALTPARRRSLEPAWSPGGRQIAYLDGPRGDTGGLGVSLLTLATGRTRRLPFVDIATGPAWSPDGTRLAFTDYMWGGCDLEEVPPKQVLRAATPPPCIGLVIARANGRLVRSWYNRYLDFYHPVWSPDARAMALSGLQVFTFAQAGSFHSLGVDGSEPAWQPLCGVSGNSASNSLRGTSGHDLICGFDGNDRINGRRGADQLLGGRGNDRIDARDGAIDIIGCGPGTDWVTADRRDSVGADCERVVQK